MSIDFKFIGDALGWIGTCFSIIFFMAPAQPYSRFVRKEITLNDVPVFLLVFSYLNCVSWIPYGIRDYQPKPTVCNCVGAILTLVFILVFCAFFVNLNVKKTLICTLIIFNLTFQLFWICYYIIKSVKTLGLICMIFNIFMYAGTLEKFTRVISTNNYHLIPILSAMLMLVNALCWTIYGFAYKDINIIIANTSGVILEGIAVVMWCYLRKKYPDAGIFGNPIDSNSQSQINKTGLISNNNNKNEISLSKINTIANKKSVTWNTSNDKNKNNGIKSNNGMIKEIPENTPSKKNGMIKEISDSNSTDKSNGMVKENVEINLENNNNHKLKDEVIENINIDDNKSNVPIKQKRRKSF